MADPYKVVVRKWLSGMPPRHAKFSIVRGSDGYQGKGPLHAPTGTPRLSYDANTDETSTLYSYKMPIAWLWRQSHGLPLTVLINADPPPTQMSSQHFGELRWGVDGHTISHPVTQAILSFSILDKMGLDKKNITIIGSSKVVWTRVKTNCTKVDCPTLRYGNYSARTHRKTRSKINADGSHTHDSTILLPGHTLFRVGKKFYLAGRRLGASCEIPTLFIALLPKGEYLTVQQAVKALRPKGLPRATKQQGKWFFAPVKALKPPNELLVN